MTSESTSRISQYHIMIFESTGRIRQYHINDNWKYRSYQPISYQWHLKVQVVSANIISMIFESTGRIRQYHINDIWKYKSYQPIEYHINDIWKYRSYPPYTVLHILNSQASWVNYLAKHHSKFNSAQNPGFNSRADSSNQVSIDSRSVTWEAISYSMGDSRWKLIVVNYLQPRGMKK